MVGGGGLLAIVFNGHNGIFIVAEGVENKGEGRVQLWDQAQDFFLDSGDGIVGVDGDFAVVDVVIAHGWGC